MGLEVIVQRHFGGTFKAYTGPIDIDLFGILATTYTAGQENTHSILPTFSRLMDQRLYNVFEMSGELIIANRFAEVTDTLMEE